MLGASLALAGSASAHPLDELAQASYVELAQARVSVELNLTPGERVAGKYFTSLAGDREGYAARVLRDLRLSLDGKPLAPTLVRSEFPADAALKSGGGSIKLFFQAEFPPLATGKHVLRYENRYEPIRSGYLVAVLVGKDGQAVGTQSRDERQRSLELTFATPAAPLSPLVPAAGTGLLALGGALLMRRYRARRR